MSGQAAEQAAEQAEKKTGTGKFEIDMTHGPMFGKILVFTLPLIFSSVLQLLFNAADIIVVGRFTGSEALAAVGSTGSLINLLTNLFLGLSVGANVLFANYVGAGETGRANKVLHTSVLLSVISGIILMVIGLVFANPILVLMGSPDDVIDLSALYLRIYFIGMPAMLFYNFGSAILRAVGDTRRPLFFLAAAGIINVFLNLFFVIVFSMGVAGVALATIISQAISAFLLLRCLQKETGACHLSLSRLKAEPQELKRILRIGIPAGLQGVIFSFSNVIIQSSVNSFGSLVMAGNAAASNIEGFVYISMNAFSQTCVSFTSQNYGAREYGRIPKVLKLCVMCTAFTGLFFGNMAYHFGRNLISIYNTDPEVISYGLVRMRYMCTLHFACGIMDVLVGSIRGMGYSVLPMVVSLLGACVLRVVWIFTVFASVRTLPSLYVSYPISWILTLTVHFICFNIIYRKICKRKVPSYA
jgi:putative MATE family efflux protein